MSAITTDQTVPRTVLESSSAQRVTRASRARVFRALAATSAKEILRDPKTLFFTAVFPFFFLGLFWFMDNTFMNDGPAPQVAVVTGSQSEGVVSALEGQGITATTDPAAGSTAGSEAPVAWIEAGDDSATTTLTGRELPARGAVLDGLREAGFSRTAVEFTGADGTVMTDMLATSLPSVLMVALLSLAFLGTAAPLVGLRQRGTLRLLGTMPIDRTLFMVSQWPIRVGIAGFQLAVIATAAWTWGLLDFTRLPQLLLTTFLGLLALFALGYLVVARIKSQELATAILALLLPLALLLSGAMMPKEFLPDALVRFADFMPTTVLAQALGESMTGQSQGGLSLPMAWLVLAGMAALCGFFASRLFTWHQGDNQ